MVSEHVGMLNNGMGLEVDNHMVTEPEQAKTLLRGGRYDILHLHGCWRNSSRTVVNVALRQGTRLVITPHGQLEPWVQQENRWKEKLPKRLLYQRNIVERSYAVIVQGAMEQECMQKLAWNPRTIVIRNAVITHSISPDSMARQTYEVYRKVMDSNPLELMSEEVLTTLGAIITAGITGDRRWVENSDGIQPLSSDEWRLLLCYAHQEQLSETLHRGIRVLGLTAPDIDPTQISYFVPKGYQQADSIQKTIGNEFPSENERLLSTFRYLRRLSSNGQLGMKHLIELDRELREHGCEEEALSDELKERHLWKHASRLMQLMADLTGLTEGFMPIPPTNDRIARRMEQEIIDRLKI